MTEKHNLVVDAGKFSNLQTLNVTTVLKNWQDKKNKFTNID